MQHDQMRKTLNKRVLFPIAALTIGVAAWLAFGVFSVQSLFIDKRVSEAAPVIATGSTQVGRKGPFTSGAHDTKGNAILLTGTDGKSVLRFENFSTSNGPDLKVYLRKRDTQEFINAGSLKGNIGNQNYQIVGNIDPSKYDTVDIWCDRFSVSFGTAILTSPTAEATS